MKTFLRLLAFIFICLPAVAQQRSIRELDNIGQLATQVQDLNTTRFVKGYTTSGDGGGGLFVLTNTTANANTGTRFAVTAQSYSWERVRDGVINVRWFGAKGDGTTDDTTAFSNAIQFANVNGGRVYIPSGTYKVTSVPFTSCSDMVIEGDATLNHSVITGGLTDFPMFDMLTCNRMTLKNLFFTVAAATFPSCAVLIGRDSSNGTINNNGSENYFDRVAAKGNFRVACVYGISSELNLFSKCNFRQEAADSNVRTLVYLAKDATNIYSIPVRSLVYNTEGAGVGGNGGNTFSDCGFLTLATDLAGSSLVVEYGQATTVRNCFLATSGATNQIKLLKSTTGFEYFMNAAENQSGSVTHGLAILDADIYQNIHISGFTYPIYAATGAQLSHVIVDNCTLSGTAGQTALDVDIIRDSTFRFSNYQNVFGGGVTNFVFNVRSLAENVDFGVPTNRVTVAGSPNRVVHHGNHIFSATGGGVAQTLFAPQVDVIGSNVINTANYPILSIRTIDTAAIDLGGTVGFGGNYLSTNWPAYFGTIRGAKENNILTNYSGYLQFNTIAHAGSLTERMRIDSLGQVGIGKLPGSLLDVAGTINAVTAFQVNDIAKIISGPGSPEGFYTAFIGSLFLRTDGGPGTTIWEKSTGTGNTGWQPLTSAASIHTFNTNQFTVNALDVSIRNNALTTNLVLKGAPTTPTLNVSGANIDAAIGSEFSKELASNTSMGIINMTNDQAIHFTVTNTTFTLSFTNADITWISSIVPVLDTNAVNVFHFRKTGGRIFGSDPEQVANASSVAITAMTGTGVMIKTNATTIVTQDPLSVRYGGTGTNTLASVADGNVVFHKLGQDALGTDDAQFLYSSSLHTLYLNRTVPTGSAQLVIAEGSGGVPILSISDNQLLEANDDLSFGVGTGFNLLAKINSVTAFTVSSNLSTIIGDGTTTTTRTNKFLYIPSTLGVPTGVPTTVTGTFPIAWDSSNDHLYIYDTTWKQLDGGGITGLANPSVSIGLSAVNGTALTAMRSDAAPPISQSIVPTWTGTHTFRMSGDITGAPIIIQNSSTAANAADGSMGVGIAAYLSDTDLAPYSAGAMYAAKTGIWDGTAGNRSSLIEFICLDANVQTVPLMLRHNNVIIGDPISTGQLATSATRGFLYISSCAGTPTGVPVTENGRRPIVFDTTGNKLWAYDGGWIDLTGSGGGSDNDNIEAVSGSLTNDFLNGELFMHNATVTNRIVVAANTTLSANSLSFLNNGSAGTVQNGSATRLSHLTLKGGLGAETYIQFFSSNIVVGTFDTNRLFNAFYGTRSANSVITNGVTVLDVQATNIIGLDAAQKIAKVNIGGGLTWTPATMTLSVAGGGALAGSGTPTYYAAWDGAASLGDGGLYNIDSTALGLGSTNFFIHTHGGINNLGVGEDALANSTGSGNLGFGRQALMLLTTGSDNIAAGYTAMISKQAATKNIAIGRASMAASGDNHSNTFLGWYSATSLSTGNYNSGIGAEALFNTTTGDYNTVAGTGAGFDNLTGAYNTYVGALSGYFDGNGTLTYTNTSQVGYGALATNNNSVVLGNENVTRWELGNGGPTILKGTGTPEGADQGDVGDIFIRTDGAAGTTMYWKETGSGNTGWASKGSMSSEVTRLHIESGKLPGANPARFNPVSDYLWEAMFDPTTSQSIGYSFIMPQGYGSALKVRFKTTVKTVQTGTKSIVYRFSVAAMKATEDPTNPTFATANSVTVTLGNNQAANAIVESTVNLTNADSVVAGDLVLLKVDRNAGDGADDAAGDSALIGSLAVEWLKQ